MKKIFDYKPSRNYLNISSMEELKLAKAELKGEIREKERDICDDFNEVVYMLSPGRIMAAISARFDLVNDIAAGIKRGYRFIHDIINNRGEEGEESKD